MLQDFHYLVLAVGLGGKVRESLDPQVGVLVTGGGRGGEGEGGEEGGRRGRGLEERGSEEGRREGKGS